MKKTIIIFVISILFATEFSFSQYYYSGSAYRLGVNVGLNNNTVGLGYQKMLPNGSANWLSFYANDGSALAPYFGLTADYLSGQWWGLGLRLSYDSRNVLANDESMLEFGPNPEFDITANYLSIEPSFRINQSIIPELYFAVGPLLSFNLDAKYNYKPDKNQDFIQFEDQEISNVNPFVYGLNLGLGYDIQLSYLDNDKIIFLTPFFDFSLMTSQRESDFSSEQNSLTDVWSTYTMRLGIKAAIEFPLKKNVREDKEFSYVGLSLPTNGEVVQRIIEEQFPLVPYVFFDAEKQDIPPRYIRLAKFDARNYDETKILSQYRQGTNKPRTDQHMMVYYNIINIFAKRMITFPNAKLRLIGSAPIEKDGEVLAQKVKNYITEIMGIESDRIAVEGVENPRIISGSSSLSGTDKEMADLENRRVEFVFDNEELYKPVNVRILDEYPVDSDLEFNIFEDVKFSNWSLSISGEGVNKVYGPFYERVENINPVELMKGLQKGSYRAKVVINSRDGKTVIDENDFELVKRVEEEVGNRFTILFNYGQSDAVKLYENNIRNVIAPMLKEGNQLIVHGHTDILGSERSNKTLSIQRAKEVKQIFDDQIRKSGRRINTKAIGYGEDVISSTFNNLLPEGRFYNRNVQIDIIPLKKTADKK